MSRPARSAPHPGAPRPDSIPPASLVRLRLTAPGLSRVLRLPLGDAEIGQAKSCSLRIPLATIPDRAVRFHQGPNRLRVTSIASEPLILNGKRVPTGATVDAKDRDRIEIGSMRLLVIAHASTGPSIGGSRVMILEGLDADVEQSRVRLPYGRGQSLRIGRRPDSDLRLSVPKVSAIHAIIVQRANGTRVLIDKGSRNGSAVNGRACSPYEPTVVGEGDVVEIGPIAFLVRDRSELSSHDSARVAEPNWRPLSDDWGVSPGAETVEVSSRKRSNRPAPDKPADRVASPEIPTPDRVRPRDRINRIATEGWNTPKPLARKTALEVEGTGSATSDADGGDGPETERVPKPDLTLISRMSQHLPPTPLMGPALLLLQGPDEKHETRDPQAADRSSELERVVLPRSTTVIGRSPGADLVLPNRAVSAVHAVLDPSGEGQEWEIRDADSANGIRVNGARVPRFVLRPWDMIRVGPYRFTFVAAGQTWPGDLANQPITAVPPSQDALPAFVRNRPRPADPSPRRDVDPAPTSAAGELDPLAVIGFGFRVASYVAEGALILAALGAAVAVGLAYAGVLPSLDELIHGM